MENNSDKTHGTTPVDTVDAATADLLESAVEDEPGDDWPVVDAKVLIINMYLSSYEENN